MQPAQRQSTRMYSCTLLEKLPSSHSEAQAGGPSEFPGMESFQENLRGQSTDRKPQEAGLSLFLGPQQRPSDPVLVPREDKGGCHRCTHRAQPRARCHHLDQVPWAISPQSK